MHNNDQNKVGFYFVTEGTKPNGDKYFIKNGPYSRIGAARKAQLKGSTSKYKKFLCVPADWVGAETYNFKGKENVSR